MTPSIFFCATEAGGSRNLAPVAELAAARSLPVTIVTTSGCRHCWSSSADVHVDLTPSRLAEVFLAAAPQAAAVGTASGPSAEHQVMQLGAQRHVPVVAIVDERYGYRDRFAVAGGAQWPDAIALMDGEAVGEAVGEGLPQELCHVTGSPSLAALLSRARRFAGDPAGKPSGLTGDGRVVVSFVSEVVADDYGATEPGGRLGPFLGYTEHVVRTDLLRALAELNQPALLREHMHPAASEVPACQSSGLVDHEVVRGGDLWSHLWASRMVVGMRSMALVEAALLGLPTLSYQPGLIGDDRSTAVRLGLCAAARGPRELVAWCASAIARPRLPTPVSTPFAPADAAHRVLDLVLTASRRVPAGVR